MLNNASHGSQKLHSMRQDYLVATFNRQESIDRWKKSEKRRSRLKACMIISLLIGIALCASMIFLYRDATDGRQWIRGGIGLAIGLVLCLIFGLFRSRVSRTCEKQYIQCFISDMRLQDGADAIKAQTVDPILENSIVISIRSHLKAPAEYEEVDASELDENDEFDFVSAPETKKKKKSKKAKRSRRHEDSEVEVFERPVNSAIVFIDDVEVGAVDLAGEFSVFRVNPGLHSLRIKLRNEYPHYEKTLELMTPVNPVYIDGDYRILYYTVDAISRDNVHISYQLNLAEYDDMSVFRRDVHDIDRLEMLERDADLPRHLSKRSEKLYAKLSIQEKYIDTFREEEEKRYLREKYRWLNKQDDTINPILLRNYRAEAKRIQKQIYDAQTNPRLSEARKSKLIAILDSRMNELLADLYNKLDLADDYNIPEKQLSKLKKILLFGQESIRVEQLAEQLAGNRQDARLKDNKKPEIIVNVHNTIHKDY